MRRLPKPDGGNSMPIINIMAQRLKPRIWIVTCSILVGSILCWALMTFSTEAMQEQARKSRAASARSLLERGITVAMDFSDDVIEPPGVPLSQFAIGMCIVLIAGAASSTVVVRARRPKAFLAIASAVVAFPLMWLLVPLLQQAFEEICHLEWSDDSLAGKVTAVVISLVILGITAVKCRPSE